MGLFGLFRKKAGGSPADAATPQGTAPAHRAAGASRGAWWDGVAAPRVCGTNFMELYACVPEVFWPVEFIATRVAAASFVLKKAADDSLVWGNRRVNALMARPNCLMTWREMVHQHFVYKLVTGNSYVRAAMTDADPAAEKWRWCDNFWVLPAPLVDVLPVYGDVPMFGIAEAGELIRGYRVSAGTRRMETVQPWQVWHDRDGLPDWRNGGNYLKARSRLLSVRKPISNLLAVYEARNVIYVKRGGIGYLVSQKKDPTGTIALTPGEKRDILEQNMAQYGLLPGQAPFGISDQPLSFVRTNLSIQELQPFEETLADAISIAGAYGIPATLVPRKDQSTFSNQATAEKAVYTSVIMPMAQQFCRDLTAFLGLDRAGLYLDCDFSGVDCLQAGLKEREEVKALVNGRCMAQFSAGLITLNDWRAQIGESMVDDPIFSKLKYRMDEEELGRVERVTGGVEASPLAAPAPSSGHAGVQDGAPGAPTQWGGGAAPAPGDGG